MPFRCFEILCSQQSLFVRYQHLGLQGVDMVEEFLNSELFHLVGTGTGGSDSIQPYGADWPIVGKQFSDLVFHEFNIYLQIMFFTVLVTLLRRFILRPGIAAPVFIVWRMGVPPVATV